MRRLKNWDKPLTISPNRPTKHLDRPKRRAASNLADSTRRNRHRADSSIKNSQVGNRREVNRGSSDLKSVLILTKQNRPDWAPSAVGRPAGRTSARRRRCAEGKERDENIANLAPISAAQRRTTKRLRMDHRRRCRSNHAIQRLQSSSIKPKSSRKRAQTGL
jgi:hypothetical protein